MEYDFLAVNTNNKIRDKQTTVTSYDAFRPIRIHFQVRNAKKIELTFSLDPKPVCRCEYETGFG